MKLPDYIRGHSRGGTIVLLARALQHDIDYDRNFRIVDLLGDVLQVDFCAGVWPAVSPYIYCSNCKRVHKCSTAIPVRAIPYCGECEPPTTRGNWVTLGKWLEGIEPEIKVLALQYLYERQQHETKSNNTDSNTATTEGRGEDDS